MARRNRTRMLAGVLAIGLSGASQAAEPPCEAGPGPGGFGVVLTDCRIVMAASELVLIRDEMSALVLDYETVMATLMVCERTQAAETVACRTQARIAARLAFKDIALLTDQLENAQTSGRDQWRRWWASYGPWVAVTAAAVGAFVGVVVTWRALDDRD